MICQRGLTLVEILVASLILSLGILGIARFQSTLWYQAALARQQSEALYLAEQRMGLLRSYEVIPTTSGYSAYNDIASGSSTSAGLNATYTITWTVTTYTSPYYKSANITASWTDIRNTVQTMTLSSRIGQ